MGQKFSSIEYCLDSENICHISLTFWFPVIICTLMSALLFADLIGVDYDVHISTIIKDVAVATLLNLAESRS